MKEIKKFYKAQNLAYSNINNLQLIQESVVSSHSRLSKESMLISLFLEELCGMEKITFKNSMTILEPGCGVGFFSKYLANFSRQLFSFDMSSNAIELCKKFSNNNNISFFQGDGIKPNLLEPILGKKFDLIFFREFHPFSRTIFEEPKEYMYLLKEYFDLFLNENGIIFIQHFDNRNSRTLNFEKINKEFVFVYGPYHPQVVSIMFLLLRYRFKPVDRFSKLISKLIWKFSKHNLKCIVIQKK